MEKLRIALIAGARPNFMKIAPLAAALKKCPWFETLIIHTGQHYDENMSRVFFDDLEIPRPAINLGVGSHSHSIQTAKIMIAFDAFLDRTPIDLIVVVGDVNSTIACALTAVKRGIKIAHVEAGLRSFDWTMPEEINRILTDRLSNFLFCTEQSALKNLANEGIEKNKIFFTGNVMIDTLLNHQAKAERSPILQKLGLEQARYAQARYALVTLHRPNNVDEKQTLERLMAIFTKMGQNLPVIFPIHPRTEANLKKWHIPSQKITLTAPFGYLDFLKLLSHSTVVLTDSGGIQEETTILGIPCITLRETTERPVTVDKGTNIVVGTDEKKIFRALDLILAGRMKKAAAIPLWDGHAADRIVSILTQQLCNKYSLEREKSYLKKSRLPRAAQTKSLSQRIIRSSARGLKKQESAEAGNRL